jgi:hypothetical protein
MTWLAASIASSYRVETRLEELRQRWPFVLNQGIDSLRDLVEEGHQRNLQSEGGRTRLERGRRMTKPPRDRVNLSADMVDSGEQFEQPGGASS